MSWEKLERDLRKRLKGHKYNFQQAVEMVGCGEKTLRRYMDMQLIDPIKTSDEWLFTDELIDKAKFILYCRQNLSIPVETLAGIYDYLVNKGIKVSLSNFLSEASKYWDNPL